MHKNNFISIGIFKKIAFFGTPDFTTDFLEELTSSGYKPTLVITNPDRPSGRGMILKSPAPKTWAQSNDVGVLQPEKLDQDFFDYLAQGSWDLFVVVAYGHIIPEQIINLPKFGTINVHYSLLPKYRGATPVESAILNGETVTGVTVQQMRYKLDTGEILSTKEVSVEQNDTALTLRQKLNQVALILLPTTIENIFAKTVILVKQDETQATHSRKISKQDGLLDLNADPIFNDRKYRAYTGSIGSYFVAEKNDIKIRVKITKAHLDNKVFIIDEVIPENGKRLPHSAFVKND